MLKALDSSLLDLLGMFSLQTTEPLANKLLSCFLFQVACHQRKSSLWSPSCVTAHGPPLKRTKTREVCTRPFRAPTWSVVLVQDGEGEEGPVAVGGEGSLGQGRQVVHVVEAGPVRVVVARQQQVHVVRRLEPEGG